MILWIGGGIVFFLFASVTIGIIMSAPGYQGSKSGHFDGKKFINQGDVEAKGFADVIRWMMQRDKESWKPDMDAGQGTVPSATDSGLYITFVNHSTFLIQWEGINILTDPIWSQRTSPVGFAGPKRMRPPGIRFSDLPRIDLVILSHNHYDHLDLPTIKKLKKSFNPLFIVPLGVDRFLKNKGIEQVQAVDWWQKLDHKTMQVTAMPAQHFSGRGILDRDKTLWAGYMLQIRDKKLYFAGDTGYGPFFKDIATAFPHIEVALLPIGAYKPKWFMSPVHMSPEEAVNVHRQLNIGTSIGMHFGTFPLADDGKKDPVNDLHAALDSQAVDKNHFVLLEEGKSWQASF